MNDDLMILRGQYLTLQLESKKIFTEFSASRDSISSIIDKIHGESNADNLRYTKKNLDIAYEYLNKDIELKTEMERIALIAEIS